jgi:hypothetical protein
MKDLIVYTKFCKNDNLTSISQIKNSLAYRTRTRTRDSQEPVIAHLDQIPIMQIRHILVKDHI